MHRMRGPVRAHVTLGCDLLILQFLLLINGCMRRLAPGLKAGAGDERRGGILLIN